MKTQYSAILTITLLLSLGFVNAQTPGIPEVSVQDANASKISVAIIDFESQAPGNPDLAHN